MATKIKKQSLSDKISSLITAAPTNFGSDDEAEETKAKIVEQFDESDSDDNSTFTAPSSSIRKKNIGLLDEIDDRYRGKKVSKKDIYGSDDNFNTDDEDFDDDDDKEAEDDDDGNDNDSDEDGDDDDDDEEGEGEKEEEEEEDDNDDSDDSEESDFDDDEIDDENPLYRNRKGKSFENMTVSNPRDDIEKGNCVREQLKVWENLLEMRIRMQKCLVTSNKLPQFEVHKNFQSDTEFIKNKNKTKNTLMDLLENMLQVQNKLLKNYPETKKLLNQTQNNNEEHENSKNDPMDEEICSDTEDEMEKNVQVNEDDDNSENEESNEPAKKKRKTLDEYEKILSDNHEKYIPYRNSVIQLWNDKTRVASGNINKGTNQSVVKQIEFILNDKSKMIRKTQLKRSDYEIIGKKAVNKMNENENRRNQEYDSEIYDDDDFYHQLLRELIQQKSADVTDPVQLSKQWIQLQNMRNKMKRKVNTKESKGRRIRYGQIHNKLVNFMAPISIYDTWSSLAKTELYNSLFGKIQSLDTKTDNKNIVNNND